MALKNFVAREPRPLPIFIMADTSGSMKGEKIDELNLALREMVHTLNGLDDIRGKFQLAIIAFGGDEVSIVQPLTDIEGMELEELSAAGRTPMGAALGAVKELIEDREIVSSRSYAPAVILISDGIPTDCPEEIYKTKKYNEWEPVISFHKGERSSKCQCLALGIGEDADTDMLKAFIDNPEIPVVKAHDISGIAKFFRWATMSAVARMNSVNPNEISFVSPIFDIDDEDIFI